MDTVNGKMTAVADAIREKTGDTEPLTLDGMATDIPKVYDAGKQAKYDEFWDSFQRDGTHRNYGRAFSGGCWTDETFNPKHAIVADNFQASFHSNANITIIPVAVDISNASTVSQGFYGCVKLVTIQKLVVSENTPFNANLFQSCIALENLNIEGTIGVNGFDVGGSTKLTHESLMSIINALKDYSRSGESYTVTLGTTNLAKLTDEEKALATQKGWTVV